MSFRKSHQNFKSVFSEPKGNLKNVKSKVTVARIEKSRFSQRLKPNVSRECGKSFKDARNLRTHISTSNISDKTLRCKFCSKAFRHHSNLKMHSRVHLKDKSFVFGKLTRSSDGESNVNGHVIRYSLRKRTDSNKCLNEFKLNDNAGKQFSIKPKYKRIFNRTGVKAIKQIVQSRKRIVLQKEKSFSCSICKKSFRRNDHLKKHFIIHTEDKPFSCGTCQKMFKRKDHLKRHFITHTEDKPFSCGTCEKTFRRKHHLKEHFHIHSGDKPFSCYECMKGFKQKNHLKLHIRMHLKDENFSCKKCGKIFKQEIHLERHFLVHSRKNAFAKKSRGKKLRVKMIMKKRLDTNKEDNTFELKDHENLSKLKDQMRYYSSDYIRGNSLSDKTCDKDINHKYGLESRVSTRSKSKSYDCCTPDANQEDNTQLEEEICAKITENVLTDNMHSEHETESEIMIHRNIDKAEKSQDSCDSEKKNPNYIEVNQIKSNHKYELDRTASTSFKSDSYDFCTPYANQEDNRQLEEACVKVNENVLTDNMHSEEKVASDIMIRKNIDKVQNSQDSCDSEKKNPNYTEVNQMKSNHKYELDGTAATPSKSNSYDCCTPYALREDNRQLKEVCAKITENVLADNTQSEHETVNEIMIHKHIDKEESSQDSCDSGNKNSNYTEVNQMKSNNNYELDSTASTPSKSNFYDYCTYYAIHLDNRQLEEEICAKITENVLTDNTHLEHERVSKIMIHINIDKKESSQDFCDNEKKNPNCTEVNQTKRTDIFEYSVICSYCGENFKRHGDLQRHLRIHRLSLANNTSFR